MRMIHVLRKPLSEGTVAANTLRHGTGGINIDASRVGSDRIPINRLEVWSGFGRKERPAYVATTSKGRWPANVILQHLEGCRCGGVKRVKAITGGMKPGSTGAFGKHGVYGTAEGLQNKVEHGDAEGKETVANWICEPDCPVARLDADSLAGGMHSAGSSRSAKREAGKTGMFPMDGDGHRFGDTGGASRFFKQVGGSGENP